MDVRGILDDLVAEHDVLDALLADEPDESWRELTPSSGWNVADQIAHLTYFDRAATMAIGDPAGFAVARDQLLDEVMAAGGSMDGPTLEWSDELGADELLSEWRRARAELVAAALVLSDDTRVPWYGPPMSAKSFLTARLMETWAHGQDIVDALGVTRPAADRLVHIVRLGVITRSWAYANRGLEPPEAALRIELTLPSGDVFSAGDPDADERITGPAEDFCLVVTQRRHFSETRLVVEGDAAVEWMTIAQAFAGPPTDGPAPL